MLGILLRVLQLGNDLAGMATGVEVVGVFAGFLLSTSLSRMAGVHQLLLVEVVVLIFVEVSLGHLGLFFRKHR